MSDFLDTIGEHETWNNVKGLRGFQLVNGMSLTGSEKVKMNEVAKGIRELVTRTR